MPPIHSLLLRHSRSFSSSSAAATVPYGNSIAAAAGTFKWVRDRGLDHAVEREKNLIPLLNTKNLLASEPSKSLPVSAIADRRLSLGIHFRPVDFLRRYPSVFREFLPAGAAAVHPHFALTDEALELHSDETLMYRGEAYKKETADRLLKLLMLCRTNGLPIAAIRRLRLDLGLPEDFDTSLIPDFPDYFRLAGGKEGSRVLELVCWIDELSVSAMEKKGSPGPFPVQYSRGFEMDKKFKKWVEDWQKLPYFSPYENYSGRFPPADDESDRWAVAVLHEALHILVPKKTEKDNVLWLGELLGLRSRFKRALLQHPGIFYVSSKNYTHTVVLKECYRRGVLGESHPLMAMRSRYIHLMNSSSSREDTDKKVSRRREKESLETEGEGSEEESLDSSEGESEESAERVVVGNDNDDRRSSTKRGSEDPGKRRERVAEKASLGTEKREPSSRGRSRNERFEEEASSGGESVERVVVGNDNDYRRSSRKRGSEVKGRFGNKENPGKRRETVAEKASLGNEKQEPSSRGRARNVSKKRQSKGSSEVPS